MQHINTTNIQKTLHDTPQTLQDLVGFLTEGYEEKEDRTGPSASGASCFINEGIEHCPH